MKQLLCMSDSIIYIYIYIVSAPDLYVFMKQLQYERPAQRFQKSVLWNIYYTVN
jgi:hypothetical protein